MMRLFLDFLAEGRGRSGVPPGRLLAILRLSFIAVKRNLGKPRGSEGAIKGRKSRLADALQHDAAASGRVCEKFCLGSLLSKRLFPSGQVSRSRTGYA